MYRKLSDLRAKSEHYKAIGQTEHYIDEADALWDKVETVEAGSSYRLNGPTGCNFIAREDGMTFKWSINFECREANGRGYSMFDRAKLREVALRLTPKARQLFADMLSEKVLPAVEKRSQEFREAMNLQIDAEDCVRGIICLAAR